MRLGSRSLQETMAYHAALERLRTGEFIGVEHVDVLSGRCIRQVAI